MLGSAAERSGSLHFRRGPSCSWIIHAPLYLSFCLIFAAMMGAALVYGSRWIGPGPVVGPALVATVCAGLALLIAFIGGLRLAYKWGKAFRFWSATFDGVQQTITLRRGLFVPLSVREVHFAEVEALHIGHKARPAYRNLTHRVYPVSLVLVDGKHMSVLEYDDSFPARRMAEEAAAYASLPLIDASVQPPQHIPADKVGKPLRLAGPGAVVKPMLAAAPRGSRCRILWEKDTAVVRVPLAGLGFVTTESVKGAAFLVLLTAAVGSGVWWLTGDSHTTTAVVLGTLLFFYLPLLSLFLLKWLFFQLRTTTIRVDDEGLLYRTRGLLYRSTRHIPYEELRSIHLNEKALEILTIRERLRFGEQLSAAEREWLCAALNKLVTG